MDNEAPAAPAPAPAGESVANTPTNTNTNTTVETSKTDAPAAPANGSVDLHGFTPEQLGEMKKFFDNNGGFEKVKAKISNPEKPAATKQETAQVPSNVQEPAPATQPAAQPGVEDVNTLALEMYFDRLSQKPEYAGFKDEISSGKVLKEMAAMGMNPVVGNGVNIDQLKMFLDLKAKGAPAPTPAVTPEASASPTVDYVPVGENIETAEQALQILQQNMLLKRSGQAEHPATAKAKEFLKTNKI